MACPHGKTKKTCDICKDDLRMKVLSGQIVGLEKKLEKKRGEYDSLKFKHMDTVSLDQLYKEVTGHQPKEPRSYRGRSG